MIALILLMFFFANVEYVLIFNVSNIPSFFV